MKTREGRSLDGSFMALYKWSYLTGLLGLDLTCLWKEHRKTAPLRVDS